MHHRDHCFTLVLFFSIVVLLGNLKVALEPKGEILIISVAITELHHARLVLAVTQSILQYSRTSAWQKWLEEDEGASQGEVKVKVTVEMSWEEFYFIFLQDIITTLLWKQIVVRLEQSTCRMWRPAVGCSTPGIWCWGVTRTEGAKSHQRTEEDEAIFDTWQ